MKKRERDYRIEKQFVREEDWTGESERMLRKGERGRERVTRN